jgi:hypothetical protein
MAQLTAGFEEGSDILAALDREHAVIEVFRDASLVEQGPSLRCARDEFAVGEGIREEVFGGGHFCERFAALRRGQHRNRVVEDGGSAIKFLIALDPGATLAFTPPTSGATISTIAPAPSP